jgi:hypothetical protein
MKKLIIACLLLMTACQAATPTPAPSLFPTIMPSPTPVPLTDTPAPTPTLESSPTPFPKFFTTEFDSDSSLTGWVILQAGNDSVPNVSVKDNQLHIQMDSAYTWVYSLYEPEDYDTVRIDTKFVNNAMSPASVGLLCRYSDTDGWLEYNVTTDGTYNLLYGKWLSSGVADYLPIVNGSSSAIQQSGTEQQIGMICSGTTLTLLIGDMIIRNVDVSRYDLASGKVGVAASSYENTPVIMSFDWAKVSGQ